MSAPSRVILVLVCVCVAMFAWATRELHDQRVAIAPYEAEKGWFSPDPDSQYHMRRVERALLEGLPPAETDPRMNFPDGAMIPWPPYYTYVLYACVAPFAPETPEERAAFIERRVATMPSWFASLAAVVIAFAAWRMTCELSPAARFCAATIGGFTYALSGASLEYSGVGNGDHHAWVSLLFACLLAAGTHALGANELAHRQRSMRNGLVLGVLCGVMIGSWVGGLVYVTLVQLAFGLALFAHARSARPGLGSLGLGFHLAWAASIAPAVLTSPWKDAQPWIMVNLSWLHLVHPLIGAAIFLPLVLRADDAQLRTRWPWIVTAMLALLFAALAFGEFALAHSVREGFAWAGRNNRFMAFIAESQPLAWGQIGGFEPTTRLLGYGVVLLIPAWIWSVVRAWREQRLEWALLALMLPPLAAQALVQRRFADALAVPMTLTLAVALACWTARWWRERTWLAITAGLAAATVMQIPTLWETGRRWQLASHRDTLGVNERQLRELHLWLARSADPHSVEAVLATWDQGHSIEWIARRASIATNFGSYLGEDSYLDPWRFFLADDPVEAEELLARRGARHVLITGDFSKDLEVMLRVLRPETRRSYLLIPREGPVFTSQRFFTTMAARLMMSGRVGDLEKRALTGDSLGFLRLVHVSPHLVLGPLPVRHTNARVPTGWIWERVSGAMLELRGTPGESIEVRIDLDGGPQQPRFQWIGSGSIGAEGVGRVRVPYCTTQPNGDVRALGPARCTIGARTLDVHIDAEAVTSGAVVTER